MITVLSGGVGGARFLTGLVGLVDTETITVVSNTGDDITLWGLHISPDIDIVLYTLAGVVDESKGWGIRGDTFSCLGAMSEYGCESWFQLGDRDLATHVYRTHLLRRGHSLSEVVARLCDRFRIRIRILPMTDDLFQTKIVSGQEVFHFQEYLVKRGAADEVEKVIYDGSLEARPAPGSLESIMRSDTVIIAPSNPIASIGTILSVRGVRESLINSKANKIAISPLIGGKTIKGPADKMMRGLGLEASAVQVAKLYQDFLTTMIIDRADERLKPQIEALGIKTIVTNTLMNSPADKCELAKTALGSGG